MENEGIDILQFNSEQCVDLVIRYVQNLVDEHKMKQSAPAGRRRSHVDSLQEGVIRRLQPQPPLLGSDQFENSNPELYTNPSYAIKQYQFFWLSNPPVLSIAEYIHRFHRYCKPSPATYISIGNIFHNIVSRNIIPITERNAFRLFSSVFMISSKAIEDELRSMKRYASIAGLKENELKRLELSILLLIEYDLRVDHDSLQSNLSKWIHTVK